MLQTVHWLLLSFHAMHARTCPQADNSIKPGGRWQRPNLSLLAKRLKGMHLLHSMLQSTAISCSTPNTQQGMSAVLAPVAFTCCTTTQLRHCAGVGKGLA